MLRVWLELLRELYRNVIVQESLHKNRASLWMHLQQLGELTASSIQSIPHV
jgi:hypothetical protein